MARLSDPNVVQVYDVITSADTAVIVMEYVDGQTIRDWLATTPAMHEVAVAYEQAGRGLQAAHAAGLVHLDFKPANVLLGRDGSVKVTDFGLSRDSDYSAESANDGGGQGGVASWGLLQTIHGVVAGTPRYMPPEQHRGEECDHRADVYAFCVALWESLCLQPPFDDSDADELLTAKEAGPPEWRGPSIPAELRAELRRGLHPVCDRRPDSLAPVLAALRACRPRSARSRWPWLVGGVALAATTGLAAMPARPPPLEGYGARSSFGDGGGRCVVQTLADGGEGSLRECLAEHASSGEPMEISFAVGGTIALVDDLSIRHPFVTMDGLSAPDPGVTITSADTGKKTEFVIGDDPSTGSCGHDVLVQGVRFLGTWDGIEHTPRQESTVGVTARRVRDCMRNVVFNRITVIAAPDAAGDLVGDVSNVTIQYSAFFRNHHPIEITNAPGEPLLHTGVTLHHNVFAYYHERSPQIRGRIEDVDITQNIFMNWNAYEFGGGYAIRIRCRNPHCPRALNLEHNLWLPGSGHDEYALVFGSAPDIDPDDGPIAREVYMGDNRIPADNPNIGLAPNRFERPAAVGVTVVEDDELVEEVLPWVGVPHRTDVESSIFAEVAGRIDAD